MSDNSNNVSDKSMEFLDINGVERLSNHLKLKYITGTLSSNSWTQVGPSYVPDTESRNISTLPYALEDAPVSLVVLNDEIHILGSSISSARTSHYKWNGTSWSEVSTLPYGFIDGSAVIYNGEIHILGGGIISGGSTVDINKSHYKWNGTSWESVSTLPYDLFGSCAVVYNDEIHIFGTPGAPPLAYYHYKWDGTTWSNVSTTPISFSAGDAVVYNNELHIMKGTNHYKWDGTTWSNVSTIPISVGGNGAVVYNGAIHVLYDTNHYKWDGTSWSEVSSTLPYSQTNAGVIVYNDEIHMLGGNNSSGNSTKHYEVYKETYIPAVYTQILPVTGLKTTDIVIVSQGQMSAANREIALKAQITPTVQAANALTFEAKTAPTVDVPINITTQGGSLS